MTGDEELLGRLSCYQLTRALMSNPSDRAAIDKHIAELEEQLAAADGGALTRSDPSGR